VAKAEGLKYVYVGNVPGHSLESTYCAGCGAVVVKRYGFDITGWYMDKDNNCLNCGEHIPIVGTLGQAVNDNRFFPVAVDQ
jgi:pyruvate formate lyase activating enzyme